jgi:hypothetical protein
MTWISVDNKLPTNFDHVLVLDLREGYNIAFYNTKYDQWRSVCNDVLYNITHWMPLPGYRESQDDINTVNNYISIDTHNELVSKLASEMYVVIGSLYASNGEVPDSTYQSLLDRIIDIVNNPSILQSNEDLLVSLDNLVI